LGTVAKDVDYRGVLVAEVDRLSVTEKRWINKPSHADGPADHLGPSKRMSFRHYICVRKGVD